MLAHGQGVGHVSPSWELWGNFRLLCGNSKAGGPVKNLPRTLSAPFIHSFIVDEWETRTFNRVRRPFIAFLAMRQAARVPSEVIASTEDVCPRRIAFGHLGGDGPLHSGSAL